jgi:hypothetical protein
MLRNIDGGGSVGGGAEESGNVHHQRLETSMVGPWQAVPEVWEHPLLMLRNIDDRPLGRR